MSRQYPKNDPRAQLERRFAAWLADVHIPPSVSTIPKLTLSEAEFLAHEIFLSGFILELGTYSIKPADSRS